MIKFALRRNLIYPLQLIIYNLLRVLETKLLNHLFKFSNSLAFTALMFIGEILAGLSVYLYQKNFMKKKKKKKKEKKYKFFSIELIEEEKEINRPDSNFKIHLLIFLVAFFDYVQFYIWTSQIPKLKYISSSLLNRLSVVSTIIDALFYYYVLKFHIFKHQMFSLIIIGVYIVIIITTEFFFQEINLALSYANFVVALLLIFVCQVLSALIDSIEKYLFEYDFLNPYYTLMLEGIFGFILSNFLFLNSNYLVDIKIIFKSFPAGNIVLFIFLLIIYIILCGGRNLYKIITTKLFSPMARTLTDYFLNPIYMASEFAFKNDFLRKGERNIAYFVINLILSILISFIGCVYNEFIVLFFCGLEHNTHMKVRERSITQYEMDDFGSDSASEN